MVAQNLLASHDEILPLDPSWDPITSKSHPIVEAVDSHRHTCLFWSNVTLQPCTILVLQHSFLVPLEDQ